VSAGSPALFRLARGGEMELRAQLAEADLAAMRVGIPVSVTPVGSTTSYQGRVWQVAPVIDPQSRQGTARIAVPYSPDIRPGGFASAEIQVGATEAPLLPQSAVQSDQRGSYVYVVTPQKRSRAT
jgi:multidrug efflux pump subunit AcrA (membrane-fusion protein)